MNAHKRPGFSLRKQAGLSVTDEDEGQGRPRTKGTRPGGAGSREKTGIVKALVYGRRGPDLAASPQALRPRPRSLGTLLASAHS